jgi:hypothetical protein
VVSVYGDSGWTTSSATKTSPSFTIGVGDVIIALAGAEDAAGGAPSVPVGSGTFINSVTGTSAFSPLDSNAAANTANDRDAYAISGVAGTFTFSSTLSSARIGGLSIWVYPAAQAVGVGAHAEQHTATKSRAVARTVTSSDFIWCSLDFSGDGTGAPSPTPTNTRLNIASTSDFLVADVAGVTVDQSYGEGTGSGGTAGPFSILVVEVLPLVKVPVLAPHYTRFPKPNLRS